MKTDKTIEFVHDPSHYIRIQSIEKFDDGSGFRSVINMQSGSFSCLDHPFYFDQMKQFLKDLLNLDRRLKGQAETGPKYEPEFIRFEATKLGHITVNGLLQEHGEHQQILRFSFETDQSYLPPFLKSIEATLKSLE